VNAHTVSNLVNGANYYFALVALNTNNLESAFSTELRFPNAPVLGAITNQTTAEETAATIPLIVTDIDTPIANVTLGATSSNLSLVPINNISFSGTGTNRTMIVMPANNQIGTASITVTASDGVLTASRAFVLTVTGSADPPSISGIGDVVTDEDVETGLISFTVSDPETPLTNLTVRAASSNPTLIPTNQITLAGTGGPRTVRLRPSTNQNGSASITLTVSDGALSRSTNFTFTVRAINDPPTIAQITNQTTAEETAATIPLIVTDIDTPIANVTLSVTSSNLSLVPINNISFSGTGTNRTMVVMPATNQTGTASITVTASDGVLTASRAFVLTVTGSADAPTISGIVDVTTDEDVQPASISFTISDPETVASNLTVRATTTNPTLIPTNRITLAGTTGTRTMTLRPVTNQHGSATITLTVSDPGGLSRSTNFNFTVLPVNDPPSITQITNRTLMEDYQTNPIAFSVNDVDDPIANLQITGTSSNPSLVPDTNIFVTGTSTSTNRTLQVRPLTNAVGWSDITLTVSDGQADTPMTFRITYTAVNDPPYVSAPPDLTVNKLNPVPLIPFTISDVESSPSQLSITLTSSNATLLPTNNMVVSGTGNDRSLALTPRTNTVGTSRISIRVSDGVSNTTVFFQFTVTGSNNPPVLTVPGPLAGGAGAAISLAGIRVADPDAGTNNLNLTLSVANGTIAVSTSVSGGVKTNQVSGNNSGTVTVVGSLVALNATLTNAAGIAYTSRSDFSGTETVGLVLNDNGNSGAGGAKTDSDSISIQVTGGLNSLERWRTSYFSAADLQDPTKEATLWGDLADPDNDGRNNLMEFALGLNPLGSEPQESAFVSATVSSGGNQYQTLTFSSRINETLVQYIPEVSADNTTWSATAVRIASTPVNAQFERVTYRDPVPITSEAARFIRLRVVKNSP
jgi:hypothetical protein